MSTALDLPLAMHMFQLTMCGQATDAYELRILSKSGDYLVGEIRGIPVYEDGRVAGAIGVARDVTERVRMERAQRLSFVARASCC